LGCVTIAQSLIEVYQSKNLKEEIISEDKELENNFSIQCQLCLGNVPDTVTPCGHLFCWTCLTEWLRTRNQCPICREIVIPSKIVPLFNL
jgi:peroxin-10